MKLILLLLTLMIATPTFADEEHAPGHEGVPTEARLRNSRGCFEELSVLGCGKPQEDAQSFKACAVDQLDHLSGTCHALVKKLYRRKLD